MAPKSEAWLNWLPADPRPVLLASPEPYARFVTLTAVLGRPEDDPEAAEARRAVVTDAGVRALVGRLPDWEAGFTFGGHNAPAFPPNLLRLLHGMGVRDGDFPEVGRLLDALPRHQADDGRYLTPGGTTGRAPEAWTSLPCDHFAICEALWLFGRRDAPGMEAALARVAGTLADTAQGPAWHCLPDPVAKWRGPGRKDDACLMVTVEALRLFGLVATAGGPAVGGPAGSIRPPARLPDAARTLLRAWRLRQEEKPYFFGHGRRFVEGKYPPTWYDAAAVLEALSHWPAAWKGRASTPDDRQSVAELTRALAGLFDPDGLFTPRSCYKGFEGFSFGQKKRPSHWATARLCGILRRFSGI